MRAWVVALGVGATVSLMGLCPVAGATPYLFSTGTTDGKMAVGSRPPPITGPEIEAADDFVLTDRTAVGGASFTGLIPTAASLSSITRVRVEIYRVFPLDSDVGRTSGPPTFSTAEVPTRVNSPSDTRFASRDSADGKLTFTPSIVQASLTANHSVLNGIHPIPNQATGGDGPQTGEEISLNVGFTPAMDLPPGHYFVVPQVTLSPGDFLWLSAPKPIVPPGTPFPIGSTDLQTWIRNALLAPDWLRVGTDIAGATTFNGAFSVSGATCGTVTVSPTALPSATLGAPISVPFTASGGTAPFTFTQTGALPGGVSLSSAGVLSGMATQAGSFPIVVTATDADGCTGTASETLSVIGLRPPIEPTIPILPTPTPSAPAITGARLSATTFRAAPRGATLARKKRPPVGTTISYRDSQAATTTLTVIGSAAGHRTRGHCVAGAPHRHQTRCVRTVTVVAVTHHDVAGANKVRFSGRVRGLKLAPGRYRLTLAPKAGTLAGPAVTLSFRIAS
jgi:Putative Ig domain